MMTENRSISPTVIKRDPDSPIDNSIGYCNPFKFIIPNEEWKQDILKKGYHLTIISKQLMNYTEPVEEYEELFNRSLAYQPPFECLIVLTNGNNFIPLDNLNAPLNIFINPNKSLVRLTDNIEKDGIPEDSSREVISRLITIEYDDKNKYRIYLVISNMQISSPLNCYIRLLSLKNKKERYYYSTRYHHYSNISSLLYEINTENDILCNEIYFKMKIPHFPNIIEFGL